MFISLILIIAGSYKNLTFLPVVIANTLIGIIQQFRSKKVLDNLALLDVSEYKVKQQHLIEKAAKQVAREVSKTKIEAKLEPMNSYERRIVHTIISNFEKLETESFGQDPMRYVVIRYKED